MNPQITIIGGGLAGSEESEPIRRELAERRHESEAALRERLKRAKSEGDLPESESPADLARFVWSLCDGLAVQAAGGATRAELRRGSSPKASESDVTRDWDLLQKLMNRGDDEIALHNSKPLASLQSHPERAGNRP